MRTQNWYRGEVAPKQQHSWTLADRQKIYTMRVKQNLPINDILDLLGVGITRIKLFNQIRISRAVFARKCFRCRKPVHSRRPLGSLLACKQCKQKLSEYKKEMRRKYLKRGICGVCWERKVVPGFTACRKCISIAHRRRYIKGICGKCGKHSIYKSSVALCLNCLKSNKKYSQLYRARLREKVHG